MANYRLPNSIGNQLDYLVLNTDGPISLPATTMDDGTHKLFQFVFDDIQVGDQGVTIKFYSALDVDGLTGLNVAEAMTEIALTGLTGKNVFKRELNDNLDDHFRIEIAGTDPSSLTKYVINARSL